jgi:hypothetical protein
MSSAMVLGTGYFDLLLPLNLCPPILLLNSPLATPYLMA